MMETSAGEREFIRSNFNDLESQVECDEIMNLIRKRELLSSAKIQAITSKELGLFEEVVRMSSHDFSVFIQILRETNHGVLADWLMKEEKSSKLYYKMNSNTLGNCIIINNVQFTTGDVELFEERMTSDLDAENLYEMFKRIGYEVTLHRNLSAQQMKSELVKFSQLDHSLKDSSVVCVLTHGVNFGGQDILFGSDGNVIDKETIYEMFNYQNCKSLLNKPKMFFFHACRCKGYNHHSKEGLLKNIQDNEPAEYFGEEDFVAEGKSFIRLQNNRPLKVLNFPGKNRKKQPELSDIFVVHSSFPGKVAVEKGQLNQPGIFCQQLVKVFNENYELSDFDTLMNKVTKEVNNASTFENYEASVHYEKISPYGLVHFRPGKVPRGHPNIKRLVKETQELADFQNDCLNRNN